MTLTIPWWSIPVAMTVIGWGALAVWPAGLGRHHPLDPMPLIHALLALAATLAFWVIVLVGRIWFG